MKKITSFYNNQFHEHKDAKEVLIYSPYNNQPIANLEYTPLSVLDTIVNQALIAQKKWSQLTFKKRADYLYAYKNSVLKHANELIQAIHENNGKTIDEATAEVNKVIELIEFACSIPQIISGEIQKVSRGIFCREEKKPVGLFAIITPFNFPAMVPNWSIPNALALGNAVILKPSELVPTAVSVLAKIITDANFPSGLFNVVHGDSEIANALAVHPKIQGLTFVGSTPVAKKVYQTACLNNKRALCLGGAKNYVFALNDADPIISAKEILASAVGMGGQRCMALSVCLIVGKNPKLYEQLIIQAKAYQLGTNHPPIVSKIAIDKLKKYTKWAKEQNASILIDGAVDFKIPLDYKNGLWYGPTLIDWTNCLDKMGQEEVFGPVLEIAQFDHLKDAIAFQQKSSYGNSIAIFTQSARVAEEIIEQCNVGMIGINVGVAVPREPFSFGGLNLSKFGYGDITGKSSINFFTNLTKVTIKWNPLNKVDWMS